MRKFLPGLLAVALVLPSATPADARKGRPKAARPPAVKRVVITPDTRCPPPVGDEILVCGMRKLTRTELQVLHRYSQCVALQKPAEARAALASGYDVEASAGPLKTIAVQAADCVPDGRLSVSGLLFAGAMAEALLAPATRGGGLERHVAFDPDKPPLRTRDQAEVMSLCTVRAAPAEVGALLASEVASDREEKAARALYPRLSACLGRGVKLVTNRAALRASLALAAWRLVLNNEA